MLPFSLVNYHYPIFLGDFPIIKSVDPSLLTRLVGVAGVPPLALGHFQHFAQLLLHLLHVFLLQLGYYPLTVAHATAYDYDVHDCLCSACL
jgi:hypothetical protein